MKHRLLKISFVPFALVLFFALPAFAQSGARDHLTPPEVDLVRDAQILDQRIEVFIRAAERRLMAINGTAVPASKQAQKDLEKWGELPKGTRAELLDDLAKILDEAITNIDDVSVRDEKNVLIPKALRKLSAAATGFLPQLTALNSQAKDGDERAAIAQAVENAQSIVDAANKLPPPSTKKKDKPPKS
ncbi:MAG: hypothetical protein ABI923_00205 [bacterium]